MERVVFLASVGQIERYDSGNVLEFSAVVEPEWFENDYADKLEEWGGHVKITITPVEKEK